MAIGRDIGKWVKKHNSGLTLLGLALSMIALPISYIISEQQSDYSLHVLKSQNNAQYRALIDRMHGGVADPIERSNGLYAVGFERTANDTIHASACAQYVITKANGTAEPPSQVSC